LSEAPIIAIDFGERKTDSGMLMNLDQIIFHNKGFIKFGHHECIIENI
jgi:hypothetical protein